MEIIKKQISFNISQRNKKIEYIVIHDSGNKKTGANADSHFTFFNGGDRQSSADFFVDDSKTVQINDYNKYYTWHVGDGKGKYGITNSNSVGIEICVNSDGDYNEAYHNAINLTRYLMSELNIGIDKVVRHYDASRKNCPASMSENSWELWYKFKNKIAEEAEEEMEKVYNWTIEVPKWGQPTIQKLLDKGFLKGDETGALGLTETAVKILVIHDRAGVYDK